MFGLIREFWRAYSELPGRTILLLGLDGAGKTTLIEQLKYEYNGVQPLPASKMQPTVGLNIAKVRTASAEFLLWDMGGKSDLRSLWKNYLEDADGLIWVVDAADLGRAKELRDTINDIISSENVSNKPLLVFANKQDLDSAVDAEHLESKMQLVLDSTRCNVCNCSLLSGEGIVEGFTWLADMLMDG